MESVLDVAEFPLVDNKGRGEAIEHRRLRLGIDSVHAFAEATGKDRGAVTRAESGTASERTYKFLEAWLDAREEEFESDREGAEASLQDKRPGPSTSALPITIEMHGVFGVDTVTFSGSPDDADAVRRAAVEFIRDVRAREESS